MLFNYRHEFRDCREKRNISTEEGRNMHSKIKQNIKPTLPRYDTDYIYALLKDMDITV